jgi:hypothetical protein
MSCFTDNFLVFDLKGVKMAQSTDVHLDREEALLDAEKIVYFEEKEME